MSTTPDEMNLGEPITTGDLGEMSSEDALKQMRGALGDVQEEPDEEVDDSEVEQTDEEFDEENAIEGLDDQQQDLDDDEDEESDEEEDDLEDEESDDDEDSDEDDDDLNLDENPDEDEESDEDSDEDEENEGKETAETQLRKLSKIKKGLEADNDLLNEQLVSKDHEISQLQEQLGKMSSTKIDPTSHPDFIDLRSKTHNGIATQLRRSIGVDNTKALVGSEKEPKWGRILTEVASLGGLPFEQQDEVENNLRLHIAKRLGFQGDKLDPDYDEEHIRTADNVIRTFENFSSNYDQLADLHETIVSKSNNKSLELGHKEYQQKTKSVREGMAIIETMDEKAIQEDPDSLQSLAAQKIRRSPQMKTQFDKIKKMVIEMAYGPEALSQEELDKHAASGKDMDEFHKKRNKRVEQFRNERLTEIASAMLLWPEIKEEIPKHFKNKSNRERNESKKKVLRKAGKRAPTSKKKATSDDNKSIDDHRSTIASALGM